MAKISASLLAADFSCIKKDLEKIKHVDMFHIDVMDGKFVPNLAMGPDFAKSIRKLTKKNFDVHLMVISPENYFKSFSMADSITFHIETGNVDSNIRKLKNMKKKVGLAINPETDVKKILPYLKKVDKVLVMSVHPGFAGQRFIVYSLEKIKKIRAYIKKNKLKTMIEVDGGIGPSNYKKVISAGADILAMGAALFKNRKLSKFVKEVKLA